MKSSSVEEGHQIDVVHQFVEVSSHLQFETPAIRSDLYGMFEFLHFTEVAVVDSALPILLIFEEQVQKVAVLLKGKIVLMIVYCCRQLQKIIGQVGHPTVILFLPQKMRLIDLFSRIQLFLYFSLVYLELFLDESLLLEILLGERLSFE